VNNFLEGKNMQNMEKHAKETPYFLNFNIPILLRGLLKVLNKPFSLVDLGCGDGSLLYALYHNNLLKDSKHIVGVDISKTRIKRLSYFCPFADGIIADVQDLSQIHDNYFDIAISTQVIEHVPSDFKMLQEVNRILKSGGYLYISTVIKKRCGFWIYWNKGFKLDPTHVREYSSDQQFINLLRKTGFKVIKVETKNVTYPLIDLIIRLLIYLGLIKPQSDFYLRHSFLSKLRNLKFKVIGYQTIEVLSKVIK
jgi:ubiquinone/menaquinone biosynthesis C-methylase UbiE